MYSVVFISILLGLSVAVIESYDDTTALCTYSISLSHVKQYNHSSGSFVDGNNTHHCTRAIDACFILWHEDPRNKSIIIYAQGCWDGNDPNCKKKNECIAVKRPNKIRNTSFCCCLGNFCNSNITDGYLNDSTEPPDPARQTVAHMSYPMQIVIAIVVTVAVIVVFIISYFVSQVFWKDPKRSNESLNLIEAPPPPPPTFDLDTLKINKDTIGQGGFGSVYCGTLADRTVAVKIFPYVHKQYFFNEREIYTLSHMKHPSIPEYIGYQERLGKDERPEFLLVLSYCPQGCLQNYLKERILDLSQLCKMSLSIACGLSHLHTEILKDDKHRHCIAHRDLTSKNILMKADGTCMLCDFGFALQVTGSKYYMNGQEGQAEADSLAEVGTLRYKAPELLEGSVNLRDLESSLKQIDIYALGLILWEISSRCGDLYQGLEVPSYKLPFEAEVGAHASTEQIKICVVVRKCRPLFPEIWKNSNPAVNSLKETIDECWDQDAEARLTALCVEERLSEFSKSFFSDHSGNLSSPMRNSNLHKSCSFNKNEINNDLYDSDHYICPRERANSSSECTTDTLLSPSTEAINVKNNLMNSTTPPGVAIQPFQGRNPCLARNLMLQQSVDLPVIDNCLEYSMKNSRNKIYSHSDGDTVLSVPGSVEARLLANTHCNPIPYVQNQVNPTPKKPNLLGHHVSKDFLNKITGLLVSFNRKTSSNNYLPEEQQLLRSSAISSPISPVDSDAKHGQTNPVDSFWSCNDLKINDNVAEADEARKPNDSIPTAELLNTSSVAVAISEDKPLVNNVDAVWNGSDITHGREVSCSSPIDKSKRPSTLPVHSLENGLDASGDIHEESDVDISKEMASDVPVQNGKVARRGSGNRRKGVRRVQTPYEINARFSLIDDRIMSSQQLSCADVIDSTSSQFDNVKPSASVPNMNTLCSSQAMSAKAHIERKGEVNLKGFERKPVNGVIVPVVNQNGHQNVLIV